MLINSAAAAASNCSSNGNSNSKSRSKGNAALIICYLSCVDTAQVSLLEEQLATAELAQESARDRAEAEKHHCLLAMESRLAEVEMEV